MKISNIELIADLKNRNSWVIEAVENLSKYPLEQLNKKQDSSSWSALECVEHLNRYSEFYLPEIKKQMLTPLKGELFKSGRLGNYFAESMLPKEKLNKMKTFESMNPKGSTLNEAVLTQFIQNQKDLLALLDLALNINLTKTKTAISISNFIKLRLGDTLRVVIYHNQRHIEQAQRAIGK